MCKQRTIIPLVSQLYRTTISYTCSQRKHAVEVVAFNNTPIHLYRLPTTLNGDWETIDCYGNRTQRLARTDDWTLKEIDPDFYHARKVIQRQKKIARLERLLEESKKRDKERDRKAKEDYEAIQTFLTGFRNQQKVRARRFVPAATAVPYIRRTPRSESPNLQHPPTSPEGNSTPSVQELTPCEVTYIKGDYCDCKNCVRECCSRR